LQEAKDVQDPDAAVKLGGVRAELPAIYDTIRLVPLPATQAVTDTGNHAIEYGWKAAKNARQQSLAGHNIFTGLLSQN
jgi:hypothetical protein